MNDKLLGFLINLPSLILIIVLFYITPSLSRKEIYFGVRIPVEKREDEELKKVENTYKIKVLIYGTILLVSLSIIFYISSNLVLYALGLILIIIVYFIIYVKAFNKVKEIKKRRNWVSDKKSVVFVSISSDKRKKEAVSAKWFIIPIIITILMVSINLALYDSIPSDIPKHYNASGQVDSWMKKTYLSVMLVPIVQIFINLAMYLSYKSIVLSKKQINADNPHESKERVRIFKYVWTKFTIISTIILNFMFFYLNLQSITLVKFSTGLMFAIILGPCFIITGYSLYLSVKYGQGGTKINISSNNNESKYVDRDDDEFWKMGSFYYNPKDPSIFVEKRFGVGWTLNFGRKESKAIIVGFIALYFLFIYIIIKISS